MKEQLIEYLVQNNGKPSYMTWYDLAVEYNIRPEGNRVQRSKSANDIWRRELQRGEREEDAVIDDIDGFTAPEGFVVKKAWGKPGNMNYSLVQADTLSTEYRETLMDDIAKFSPNIDGFSYEKKEKPSIAYEISLPDFHFGRTDLQEAKDLFKGAVSELVSRVVDQYNVERFILPIGNDLLDIDLVVPTSKGMYGATTHGTAQKQKDELEDTFRAAWITIVETVEWLQTIAPVYIINIQGNHDQYRSFYVADVVMAWFRNNENVFVNNTYEPFKFHQYGQCMLMYEHGFQKPQDYPLIMATEQPKMFAETKFRECHMGHIHKEMLNEFRGIKVRHLPSIAKSTRWEKERGYNHQRCAQALKWSKEAGLIGFEQVNAV
jgi:hypothetical protein